MADFNFYELLRLEPTATAAEIRTAFLRISKQVHPDAGGSEALFRQVNLAYEVLSDPVRRAAYDRNGYVDPDTSKTEGPAPGWRRSDAGSSKQPGASKNSAGGSQGQGSNEPPPRNREGPPKPPPTPPPPPRSEPPPSPPAASGENSAVGSLNADVFRNALLRRVAESPSGALLVAGVLLLAVSSNFGKSAPGFMLLGCGAMFLGVVGLLGRRKAANLSAMRRAGIVDIDSMTGTEFEMRLQAAFQVAGFTVHHVGGRGDFGADLVLDAPGTRVVVQAKRRNQNVGPSAVQEVVASRAHYKAARAIVITNSNFTKAAYELARSNNVEMWDRHRLIDFLANQDAGPPRTGGALLADELKAGAPTVFKGMMVVGLGMLAAALSGSKSKPKRRR